MKIIRPILSFALAVLMLMSTSYFMVGIHYCGGHAQHISFLSKAQGCENEQSQPPCHRQRSSCCEDKVIVHKSDDAKVSNVQFSFAIDQLIVEHPVVLIAEVIPFSESSRSTFSHYNPPWRSVDRVVANQVFLI